MGTTGGSLVGIEKSAEQLAAQIGLTESEIEWRQDFVNFSPSDGERLVALGTTIEDRQEHVIETFLGKIIDHDRTVAIVDRSDRDVTYLRGVLDTYLNTLTDGTYDVEHYTSRCRIGRAHDRLGMPLHYFGAMFGNLTTIFVDEIERTTLAQIRDASEEPETTDVVATVEDGFADIRAIIRGINLDMQVVNDTYEIARRELRELIDVIPDPLFVADEMGVYVLVNDSFAALYGLTPGDVEGKTDTELGMAQGQRLVTEERWDTIRSNDLQHNFDIQLADAAGDRRCYEVTTIPYRTGSTGLDTVLGYARDVTGTRRRERELETERAHLAHAQAVANLGSWHLDVASDELTWSDQVYKIFSVPRELSLTYEKFLELVHPADREWVEEQWNAALEGEEYDIEHRIHVNGETRWVRERAEVTFDNDGNPVEGIGIVQDITDRKEREQRLTAQWEYMDRVLDSTDDIFFISDTDGTVRQANRSARTVWDPDRDISGMAITELLGAEAGEPAEKFLEGVLDRGTGRARFDLTTASGEDIPYEFVGNTVKDPDGTTVIVSIGRDISELESRTRQLRVMDRVLRHNLRNDMTTITGHAEGLIEHAIDPECHSAATVVLDTARNLIQMIEKQREIVNVLAEPPDRTEVDLASVANQAVDALSETYRYSDISLDGPDEATVTATATEDIALAITEIIENAIVHNDREQPSVHVRIDAQPSVVSIQIADNGPAIPEEEVMVLVQGQEIDPLFHGSGLGLWMVHWIVYRSGGSCHVEPNEPRGNVVTIELPRD